MLQSSKHCYLLAEMTGKDSYDNLSQHQLALWQELQDLVNGESVVFSIRGVELTLTMKLTFPADMSAHWSAFKVGGGGKKDTDCVCGRCNVPYSHLGRVFTSYTVKPGDTLQKIADMHDVDVAELRIINPAGDDVYERALSCLDYEYHCEGNHTRPEDCKCYTSPRNVPVEKLNDDQDILAASARQQRRGDFYLRVHKVHAMDRQLPPEALLQVAHERCPFCMEHCVQRVVECFLRHLQSKVINEAQPSKSRSRATHDDQKAAVDRLNQAFYNHGCSYR